MNVCGAESERPRRAPSRLIALGDPTRLAIFELLANGPLAVGDLAREFPISRPAISQHLRVLKDAGLLIDRAVGTRRVYALDPSGLAALRAFIERCAALAAASDQTDLAIEGGFS